MLHEKDNVPMHPPRCSSAVLQTSRYEVAASRVVEARLLTVVSEFQSAILLCSVRSQCSESPRIDSRIDLRMDPGIDSNSVTGVNRSVES
jgi:hypothetical protein